MKIDIMTKSSVQELIDKEKLKIGVEINDIKNLLYDLRTTVLRIEEDIKILKNKKEVKR